MSISAEHVVLRDVDKIWTRSEMRSRQDLHQNVPNMGHNMGMQNHRVDVGNDGQTGKRSWRGRDLESEWKKRTGGDFPPVPQMLFNHGDGYL